MLVNKKGLMKTQCKKMNNRVKTMTMRRFRNKMRKNKTLMLTNNSPAVISQKIPRNIKSSNPSPTYNSNSLTITTIMPPCLHSRNMLSNYKITWNWYKEKFRSLISKSHILIRKYDRISSAQSKINYNKSLKENLGKYWAHKTPWELSPVILSKNQAK